MWRGTAAPLSALAGLALLVAACDGTPATAPTPTASPSATSTPLAVPSASATPASPTPGVTPTPTPPVATVAPPAPTAARTPPPVATPRPASTATSTPAPTSSPSATATPSRTPSSTPSGTPTAPPAGTPGPVAHVVGTFGVPVRLATGVVADLPGGRFVTLADVTGDSRCPLDVQCVWAGEANVILEWVTPGETRRVPVVVSPTRGGTTLGDGTVLRVIELTPTPRAGTAIAAADYVATVVVDQPAQSSAGAYGIVTVGPACAVQREGVPCPDHPLAATLVFRDPAGVEVARTLSDSAGFYAVALPAGRYTIVPFTPGGATLPRGIARDLEVAAGDWTRADVTYDSGIR